MILTKKHKIIRNIILGIFLFSVIIFSFFYDIFSLINVVIKKGTEGLYLYGSIINNLNISSQRVPMFGITTDIDESGSEEGIVVNFRSSDNTISDIRFMTDVYNSFKEKYPDEMIRINAFGSSSGKIHWGLYDMSCGDSDHANSYFIFRRASINNKSIDDQKLIMTAIVSEENINILHFENKDVNGKKITYFTGDLDIPQNDSVTQIWCPLNNAILLDIGKFQSLEDMYLYIENKADIENVPEFDDAISVHVITS